MSLPVPTGRTSFSLPFSVNLTRNSPRVKLDFRANLAFVQATALFESVRLEGLRVDITVIAGAARGVEVALNTLQAPPPDTQFLSAPVADLALGSDAFPARLSFCLPQNHSFGTELKATAVGNQPPVLHVRAFGGPSNAADTPFAFLRGVVDFSAHGVGVLNSIPIN